MSDDDPLADFPVVISIPVRWGDLDAFQHVNNTVIVRFFESARIALFERVGIPGRRGRPGGVGPIVHSVAARFRAPIGYPDTVRVGARVTDVDADRFATEYRLVSERSRRVAASGDDVVVSYDYGAGRKAALPESWRRGLDGLTTSTP